MNTESWSTPYSVEELEGIWEDEESAPAPKEPGKKTSNFKNVINGILLALLIGFAAIGMISVVKDVFFNRQSSSFFDR